MQTSLQTKQSELSLKGDEILQLLQKRSFATLATTSPAGWPHAAGILYELVGQSFFINTLHSSRKARNIVSNAKVGVCVPVRRLPIGPPSTIHFQANAELLDLDHPEVTNLLSTGKLKSLTAHGELDLPDGCFVRITPRQRVLTHGLGMSLRALISDPLSASGSALLSTSGSASQSPTTT